MAARQTIKQRIALDGGKEIRAELEALGAAGKKAFQQLQKAANDLKGPPPAFVKAMQDAQKQLKALGDSFRKTGEQFQKSGRTFSAFVTAPIIAGFGASVKAAVDFESAMADVRKVVDFPTPAAFEQMGKDISDMSLRLPIAADGLAAIAAAAGQAGIAAGDLTQFTELVAKASVAFELTAEEAGGALAKIKTALGLSIPEVELLADALNQLANNAATSEADILDIVARVGALGKMSGVSVKEIAALGSAMVSMGVDSERAATGLRNILLRMQAGERATKEQQGAWKQLGLDSVQVARDIQRRGIGAILDVFERINKQAPTVRASIINALFGERVVDAAGPLIGNLKELRRQLALVQNEADYVGSTAREFGVRSETAANSLTLFVNQISALRREIGGELLPPLLKLVAVARDMVKGFSALSGETKRQIIGFGLVAAAVGPVLIAFGALLRSIAAITTAARVMFGVLLFARANPIVAGLTLVGTLIGGWAASTDGATQAMERHKGVVDSAAEAYDKVGRKIAEMTQQVRDRLLLEARGPQETLERQFEAELAKMRTQLQQMMVLADESNPFAKIMQDFIDGKSSLEEFSEAVVQIGKASPEFDIAAQRLLGMSDALASMQKEVQVGRNWIDLYTGAVTDSEFASQQAKLGVAGYSDAIKNSVVDVKAAGEAVEQTNAKVEELGKTITVTKFGDGGPVKQVYELADGVARAVDQSKTSLDELVDGSDQAEKKIAAVGERVATVVRSVPQELRGQTTPAEALTEGLDEAGSQIQQVATEISTATSTAKQGVEALGESWVETNKQAAAALSEMPDSAKAAVDALAAEVSRIPAIMAEVQGSQALADAILEPFQKLVAAIDGIMAGIRDTAQNGFTSLIGIARQLAGEIDAMITRIIAALRQAAAEAAKLRAAGSSSSSSSRAPGHRLARGGHLSVGPGTSTSDSIPAWLSLGEFVTQAKAVAYYGPGLFHALNKMLLPKDFLKGIRGFSLGGLADGIRSSMSSFSIPQFAGGGLANAALALAPAAATGRPVVLQLPGGQMIGGFTGTDDAVAQLQRHAAGKAMTSAGRKPGWYR